MVIPYNLLRKPVSECENGKHTIYLRVRCVNQNNGLSWDLWVSCGKIINYLRLNCYTRPSETIKLINEFRCVWVKEGIVRLNCEILKLNPKY